MEEHRQLIIKSGRVVRTVICMFFFQPVAVLCFQARKNTSDLISEQWAKEVGDQRWSWEGLLPFFKKSETFIPGVDLQDKDLHALHGGSGPIKVSNT